MTSVLPPAAERSYFVVGMAAPTLTLACCSPALTTAEAGRLMNAIAAAASAARHDRDPVIDIRVRMDVLLPF